MTHCVEIRTIDMQPCGCDTFIAFPPTTRFGIVIFGKNSDRPANEKQSICRYPATVNVQDTVLQCTYLCIPQVPQTYAVLLSQIDWMWGAEMGTNEHGVIIGNEAVWTKEPVQMDSPALLGMDLVRLGLERGKTAHEALLVITSLLEKHGQGGACAEGDDSFSYHNSFIIADASEAWILETSDRHWAAERVTAGSRNISNGLTIGEKIDLHSNGLQDYAKERGYWTSTEPFNFSRSFDLTRSNTPGSRQVCGENLLKHHAYTKSFTVEDMMKILQDHDGDICMHGGFETTASMVSELSQENKQSNRHWMTGKPHPCNNDFILQINNW